MSIDFWGDKIYLIFGLLAILKIFAESTEVMELKMTAEKFIENLRPENLRTLFRKECRESEDPPFTAF